MRSFVINTASLCVFLVFTLAGGSSLGFSRTPQEPPPAAARVLVKFHDGIDAATIARIVETEGGTIKDTLAVTGVHVITLPEDVDVVDAVGRFNAYEEVQYAEPAVKATPLEEK